MQRKVDYIMFYKYVKRGKVTILIVYVDEIIMIGNNVVKVERLKKSLAKEFEIKDLGKWDTSLVLKLPDKKGESFYHNSNTCWTF